MDNTWDQLMNNSLSKGEQTSQVILDTAYTLFLEQGYHATSMRQIAQRAGLALGGIYNHFESKEQIFETVLIEKHPYRQVLQILLAAPGDSLEQFAQNAARTMLVELGQRPDFLKLAFIELSEFNSKHITMLSQIIFPGFYPLFQRFMNRGNGLRELPLQAILLSFIGTFLSYFLFNNLVAPSSAFNLDDVALEQYIDIFLHGVINPDQNPSRIPGDTPEINQLERL
jgi:AcrR family transcriptional regulator